MLHLFGELLDNRTRLLDLLLLSKLRGVRSAHHGGAALQQPIQSENP